MKHFPCQGRTFLSVFPCCPTSMAGWWMPLWLGAWAKSGEYGNIVGRRGIGRSWWKTRKIGGLPHSPVDPMVNIGDVSLKRLYPWGLVALHNKTGYFTIRKGGTCIIARDTELSQRGVPQYQAPSDPLFCLRHCRFCVTFTTVQPSPRSTAHAIPAAVGILGKTRATTAASAANFYSLARTFRALAEVVPT